MQANGIKNINRMLIDGLMDVRLSLSILRMNGKKIKLSKFKSVVDDVKTKIADQLVKEKLSEVFEEFFDNKKQNEIKMEIKPQKNNIISLSEMEGMLNNEKSYAQEKEYNGSSLIKHDKHFVTKPDGKKDAA